jgi:hypothetical protein
MAKLTLERRGRQCFDEGDGLRDPRLQLGEARLLVRIARQLDAGETSGGVLGEVAGDLGLTLQVEHVRREPEAEHHLMRDLARVGVRLGLGETAGERRQDMNEDGNGRCVEGHGLLLS